MNDRSIKTEYGQKKIPASRGLQAYASASGTPEGYRNSKTARGLPRAIWPTRICPTAGRRRKMMKKENKKDRKTSLETSLRGLVPEELIRYMTDNGFHLAPASTKYHGAYPGGLFDHSMAVADALVELTSKLGLKWQNDRSPVVVGLLHDLCKIDQYIKETGADGKVTYSYNKNTLISGHGDKSIILASQFMTLTEEEIACIRWHMGAFDEKENWSFYGNAVEKYPNVLYTHTADMIASRIKGI